MFKTLCEAPWVVLSCMKVLYKQSVFDWEYSDTNAYKGQLGQWIGFYGTFPLKYSPHNNQTPRQLCCVVVEQYPAVYLESRVENMCQSFQPDVTSGFYICLEKCSGIYFYDQLVVIFFFLNPGFPTIPCQSRGIYSCACYYSNKENVHN